MITQQKISIPLSSLQNLPLLDFIVHIVINPYDLVTLNVVFHFP